MKKENSPPPWTYYLPHFSPLVAYFLVRASADYLPFEAAAHWAYIFTVPVVAAVLITFRGQYTELQWKTLRPTDLGLAVGTGMIGILLWILPYHLAPEWMERLGLSNLMASIGLSAGSVDEVMSPEQLEGPLRFLFLAARITGAVILIPFAEELFHRSGILRFIIRSDFRRVPIGAFSWVSFGVGTAFFALSHEEWLVAAVWGVLVTLLLYRTKRLETCIIAHAVSNLLLAGYVLHQKAWYLW